MMVRQERHEPDKQVGDPCRGGERTPADCDHRATEENLGKGSPSVDTAGR